MKESTKKKLEEKAKNDNLPIGQVIVWVLDSWAGTSPAAPQEPAPPKKSAQPTAPKKAAQPSAPKKAADGLEPFKDNTRAYNALNKAGVKAPEDLCEWTEADILALKGCGATVATFVADVMKGLGLSLKEGDKEPETEPPAQAKPIQRPQAIPQSSAVVEVEEDDEDVLLAEALATDDTKTALQFVASWAAKKAECEIEHAKPSVYALYKECGRDVGKTVKAAPTMGMLSVQEEKLNNIPDLEDILFEMGVEMFELNINQAQEIINSHSELAEDDSWDDEDVPF